MGNLGTTPSWDDEQIAKFGFWAHMDFLNGMNRARRRRTRERRDKEKGKLLSALRQVLAKKMEEE